MQNWCSTQLALQRISPLRHSPISNKGFWPKTTASRPNFRPKTFKAAATRNMATQSNPVVHGDLNNTEVLRKTVALPPDLAYSKTSLAIPTDEDDKSVRAQYRPFLLPGDVTGNDWVSKLELSTALKMAEADIRRSGGDRLKVMVLYGSLRSRYVIIARAEVSNDSLMCQVVFPPTCFRVRTYSLSLGL